MMPSAVVNGVKSRKSYQIAVFFKSGWISLLHEKISVNFMSSDGLRGTFVSKQDEV